MGFVSIIKHKIILYLNWNNYKKEILSKVLNKKLDRINDIDTKRIGTKKDEKHLYLATLFLKRLARFYYEKNIFPLPPFASNIAKSLGYDESEINFNEYLNDELIVFLDNNRYKKNIFTYYLSLLFISHEKSENKDYLNVYEPLIEILEDGGDFLLNYQYLKIPSLKEFPMRNWYKKFLDIDLEDSKNVKH